MWCGRDVRNAQVDGARANGPPVGLGEFVLGAGAILICATNNVPAPTYPGQFSFVISVAAHDGQDPFCLDANPAPRTDFGAPSIDIPMPWLSGSTIVSTATRLPRLTWRGWRARMLSKHPRLTPYEVKTVLRAAASNAVAQGASHYG